VANNLVTELMLADRAAWSHLAKAARRPFTGYRDQGRRRARVWSGRVL